MRRKKGKEKRREGKGSERERRKRKIVADYTYLLLHFPRRVPHQMTGFNETLRDT